jgi:hypothetical protein
MGKVITISEKDNGHLPKYSRLLFINKSYFCPSEWTHCGLVPRNEQKGLTSQGNTVELHTHKTIPYIFGRVCAPQTLFGFH